ncbi:Fe-Mn family superoxide dismutase [endosymbiont of Pachyrhynchus infernalis]|uniref:Fe-Mn family superoxide dismutase n=1 Tax=endosymbiont of Pachyrhynchus infernalis TaxID=1971488 RepID=UPI000DC6F334|nr:Fe-Mn family superoxide dismutase [endosymbiont of Pachyrhynchus infernalis]BBA84913.1 superoxide dismutase [endosymbiont of Pachyrhynchus infernalis]
MNNIKLPNLNFNFNYFEPYIDTDTMKLHYFSYHKSYVDNLNNILKEKHYLNNFNLINLIENLSKFPRSIRNILRYNIGGYINHNFFWESLGYNNNIHNSLINCINKSFGNINKLKNEFEYNAISSFGVGWLWLILNDNNISILFTKNNDNPIMGFNFCKTFGYPILVLDLWEHSYLNKYKNNILNYVKSFWKIINWNFISYRYLNIKFKLNKSNMI